MPNTIQITGEFGYLNFGDLLLNVEALPDLHPDPIILTKWSGKYKETILIEIEDKMEDCHERPDDIKTVLNFFPSVDQLWEPKHKIMAVLCMRVLLGMDWFAKTMTKLRHLEHGM